MSRDRNARPAITSSSGMGNLLRSFYREVRQTSEKMLRPRLLEVGIKALDDVAVALLDHAALQFHRKGQLTVRDGEIFRQQRESLGFLVLRETRNLALEFDCEERMHPGICGDLLMRRQSVSRLAGLFSDRVEIRNEKYTNKFAPVADHDGIGNILAAFQAILDGLRRHKFPRRGLEQLLLAVGDDQIPLLIEVPDIASAQP